MIPRYAVAYNHDGARRAQQAPAVQGEGVVIVYTAREAITAAIDELCAQPDDQACPEYTHALDALRTAARWLACREARRRACGLQDGGAEQGAPEYI